MDIEWQPWETKNHRISPQTVRNCLREIRERPRRWSELNFASELLGFYGITIGVTLVCNIPIALSSSTDVGISILP